MKNEIKYECYKFLRLAITGHKSGPDLKKIVEIIGIDEAFERINNFCDIMWQRQLKQNEK